MTPGPRQYSFSDHFNSTLDVRFRSLHVAVPELSLPAALYPPLSTFNERCLSRTRRYRSPDGAASRRREIPTRAVESHRVARARPRVVDGRAPRGDARRRRARRRRRHHLPAELTRRHDAPRWRRWTARGNAFRSNSRGLHIG